MKKRFSLIMSMVFIMVMVISTGGGVVHAATDYYVSQNGSDSNSGTDQQHPFRTIQKAANMVTAGGTVHVAAGQYNALVVSNADGTSSAGIKFISDTPLGATIHTAGTLESFPWTNTGDYVTIQGFDIRSDTARIGILNYGNYCLIKGNKVHDFPISGDTGDLGGAGICSGNYSDSGTHPMTWTQGTKIIGNVIFNIGPTGVTSSQIHGIYVSDYGETVQNNIVSNCVGIGIHCWHAASNVTISNNLVFENHNDGILIGAGDAPSDPNNSNYWVYCNNCVVSNNISYNNGGYGIDEYGRVGSNNTFYNNCVLGNTSGQSRMQYGVLQGTVTQNPNFVNYQADGTGDYHLAAGSPCIDAGVGLSYGAPTTDYDGVSRPQGNGNYDIGPYEYLSGGTTLTFWNLDNYSGSTTGYWYKQALIDGTVVWEKDIADAGETANAWYQQSVDISSYISGKSTFDLQFRLISKQGVFSFGVILNVDDVAINGLTITNPGFETTSSGWTYSENKASFTGSYDTSVYHGGTKSYLMQYPDSTASSANDYCKISQTVTNNWNSKASWPAGVHDLGSGNSGNLYTEFDLTPQVTNVNATIGYAAAGVTVDDFSKMAMIIAMSNAEGHFTVRNGANYTYDNVVAYSANTKYHFKVVPNFTNHTYSVYVTPNGGSQTTLAQNYSFRSDAPTTNDIGQISLKSDSDNAIKVENHVINTVKTLTFWQRDNYGSSTTGYWYKQALIDGTVVWEEDIAAAGENANTWYQQSVDVSSNVNGKSNFNLEFRLISKQGVTNFPADLYWDDIAINGLSVTNPGFETTGSGWTYSENKTSYTGSNATSVYHGGTKSYLMQYPGSTASSANDYCKISQTVSNP